MKKPTVWLVRPAKAHVSPGFRPVWSESSLCAQWVAKDAKLSCGQWRLWSYWADARVFAGRTSHFVSFTVWRLTRFIMTIDFWVPFATFGLKCQWRKCLTSIMVLRWTGAPPIMDALTVYDREAGHFLVCETFFFKRDPANQDNGILIMLIN